MRSKLSWSGTEFQVCLCAPALSPATEVLTSSGGGRDDLDRPPQKTDLPRRQFWGQACIMSTWPTEVRACDERVLRHNSLYRRHRHYDLGFLLLVLVLVYFMKGPEKKH